MDQQYDEYAVPPTLPPPPSGALPIDLATKSSIAERLIAEAGLSSEQVAAVIGVLGETPLLPRTERADDSTPFVEVIDPPPKVTSQSLGSSEVSGSAPNKKPYLLKVFAITCGLVMGGFAIWKFKSEVATKASFDAAVNYSFPPQKVGRDFVDVLKLNVVLSTTFEPYKTISISSSFVTPDVSSREINFLPRSKSFNYLGALSFYTVNGRVYVYPESENKGYVYLQRSELEDACKFVSCLDPSSSHHSYLSDVLFTYSDGGKKLSYVPLFMSDKLNGTGPHFSPVFFPEHDLKISIESDGQILITDPKVHSTFQKFMVNYPDLFKP